MESTFGPASWPVSFAGDVLYSSASKSGIRASANRASHSASSRRPLPAAQQEHRRRDLRHRHDERLRAHQRAVKQELDRIDRERQSATTRMRSAGVSAFHQSLTSTGSSSIGTAGPCSPPSGGSPDASGMAPKPWKYCAPRASQR